MSQYPFPSYLDKTADLAGNLISGYHAGAAVAEANARLQAESDHTSTELAMRERENERQAARQQQMLEMTRAYHEQTTNLRKQQLQTAAQRVNLVTQQAASKLQAQQQMTQRAQELGGAPEDFAQAMREIGPQAGISGTALAQLSKPQPKPAAWIPANVQTGEPAHYRQPSGAAFVPHISTTTARPTPLSQVTAAADKLSQLEPRMRMPGSETNYPGTYQAVEAMKRMIPGVPAAVNKPRSGKVKVRSPNGKIGYVPEDQLDDAIKEGYEQVK